MSSEVLQAGKVVLGDALDLMERTDLRFGTVFLDWPYTQASPVRGKDVGAAWRVYGPQSFLHRLLLAARRVALPGCHLYVFGDWRGIPDTGYAMSVTGWFPTTIIAWDKAHVGTGGVWRSGWDPIWFASFGPAEWRTDRAFKNSFAVPSMRGRGEHPAEKPVELWERLCAASVMEGTPVLDAFAGSGSSRAAVERAGGVWFGIDIDPTWAKVDGST